MHSVVIDYNVSKHQLSQCFGSIVQIFNIVNSAV